jgi:hypothetical protein
MRKTLEKLRRDVELNICERCYQVYLQFIEPNVRELIVKRLDDWRSTESIITQMVMKHRGVFKNDMWVISIREWDDKYHEDVDRDLFYQTKKWSFWKKIKYLKKNKILPEVCYNLFDIARDRRNNIHEDPLAFRFTEEDLDLFHLCHGILDNLQQVMRFNWSEDIKLRIINSCEASSQAFLNKI